jgi:hypothetical protein
MGRPICWPFTLPKAVVFAGDMGEIRHIGLQISREFLGNGGHAPQKCHLINTKGPRLADILAAEMTVIQGFATW